MSRSTVWLGLLASVSMLGLGAPALADTTVQSVVVGSCNAMNYPTGQSRAETQTSGGLKCVSATVSLGTFQPSSSGSQMTPLSVTTSDSSGTLPTGAQNVISNTDSTNTIYCNEVGVAATTSDQPIPPKSWFEFTPKAAVTTLHCIAVGGTVTANGLGGSGLATGSGGGGGGSGGATNATIVGPLGNGLAATGVTTEPSTTAAADGGFATHADVTSPIPTQAGTIPIGGAGALVNLSAGTIIQATASVPITFTAAGGPTQIIAASGSKVIYITHWDVVLSGAGTFALVTGTGTNCGTGTAYLTGASGHPLSFAANGGEQTGAGLGPILITGAGGEVCAITTGAVDTSGSIAYAQF